MKQQALNHYDDLMTAASDRGVDIGIAVGDILKTKDKYEAEYRPLKTLTAKRGDATASEPIIAGDLNAAAKRLIAKLP